VNTILRTFQRPRILLPVVHCCTVKQAQHEIEVAIEQGADGVFLINQGGVSPHGVSAMVDRAVLDGVPFVGVNRLDLPPVEALRFRGHAHGLWTDGAGFEVYPNGYPENDGAPFIDSSYAEVVQKERRRSGFNGLYFGGVAFKYKREVPAHLLPDLARAAVRCEINVITTSGPATGSPPTVGKIAAMRAAIGDHALAIASGITPENVAPFLPICDAFLVATGIEKSFGVFDPGKLRALADQIHAFEVPRA
jgi:uncharacterized protein